MSVLDGCGRGRGDDEETQGNCIGHRALRLVRGSGSCVKDCTMVVTVAAGEVCDLELRNSELGTGNSSSAKSPVPSPKFQASKFQVPSPSGPLGGANVVRRCRDYGHARENDGRRDNRLEPHRLVTDEPADELLSRKETAALVRDAIERLPDAYRTVVLLRDIEGFSNHEAAEILGTTANAVKIRLHRARMALRTLLAPQMGAVHP